MTRPARSALLVPVLLLASALPCGAQDAARPPVPAPPAPPRAPEPPAPVTPPSPAPGKRPEPYEDLESLLALAMRGNAEVLVAEAKVAQAEAEAHAARLRVSQAVLEARAQREQAEVRRATAERRRELIEGRVEAGVAMPEEGMQARTEVAEAKAVLAEVEARIRFLCGGGADEPFESQGPHAAARDAFLRAVRARVAAVPGKAAAPALASGMPSPAGPEALDRPIVAAAYSYSDMPLQNLLSFIQHTAGILIVVDRAAWPVEERNALLGAKSSLTITASMTLRAYLDAVGDTVGCTFVPRRYGVLLTKRVPPSAETPR